MAPSTRVRRVALCLCASGFFFALLLLASLPARLRVPEHPLLHRFEHIGHRFDVSREELNLLMHAPSPVPSETYRLQLSSGRHSGPSVSRHNVELAGVPWIQVHFVAWELGAGSYVVVRSLLDGSEAALNAEEMRVWHGTAPYLNGDHLMIELVVAEGDHDVFFEVGAVTVGVIDLAYATDGHTDETRANASVATKHEL